MEARRFMFSAREVVAALLMAIIIPMIVYRGVNLIMPQTEQEQKIRDKNWDKRSDAEKEQLKQFDRSRDRVLFLANAGIGLLVIIIGLVTGVPALGTGLVLGGGATMTTGYIMYWSYLSDLIIFISLLLALLALGGSLWWYSRKK